MPERFVEYPIGNAVILVSVEDSYHLDQDLLQYGTQAIKLHRAATNGVRFGQRVHPALLFQDGDYSIVRGG